MASLRSGGRHRPGRLYSVDTPNTTEAEIWLYHSLVELLSEMIHATSTQRSPVKASYIRL